MLQQLQHWTNNGRGEQKSCREGDEKAKKEQDLENRIKPFKKRCYETDWHKQ